MDRRERVAVITGASRGIGAAIARRLGAAGWRVAVGYAARADSAAAVVDEIERAGGEAAAFRVDLAALDDIRSFFAAVDARFGRLDLLVNNAAVNRDDDPAAVDPALFDELFHVNVRAVYACTSEAARRMLARDPEETDGVPVRGRIVNVSAIPGRTVPPPGMVLYGATKSALDGLTRSLAAYWGPHGILINAVAPGITATDALAGQSDRVVADLRNRSVLKRLGRPDDVARLVEYLATDGWMVGQSLNYSGGRLM
jgi:3-oxoacyl-[acyl-carrier protein] reductase